MQEMDASDRRPGTVVDDAYYPPGSMPERVADCLPTWNADPWLGLYVHLPFCASKCRFCFFPTIVDAPAERQDKYLRGLAAAIAASGRATPSSKRIGSVYFGGGTPVVTGVTRLCRLLDGVRAAFTVSEEVEVSVELHPADLQPGDLVELAAAGVNRVSFGVQSLDSGFHREAHRRFRPDTLELLASVPPGLYLNVDLIAGHPGVASDLTLRDAAVLATTRADAITVYPLALKRGAPIFAELGSPRALQSAAWRAQASAGAYLESLGWHRSNLWSWTRSPLRSVCRHDHATWTGADLLGIGLGATSRAGSVVWRSGEGWVDACHGRGGVESWWRMNREELAVQVAVSACRLPRWSISAVARSAGLPGHDLRSCVAPVCDGSLLSLESDEVVWRLPSVAAYKEHVCRQLMQDRQPTPFTRSLWYLP